MPFRAESLDNRIRDRLATALALCTISIGMTVDTPRIAILLHKRRTRIERITTLSTEEMTRMPLRATRNHDLPLNRGLTTLTPGTKTLMKVQMAVKSRTLIAPILLLKLPHFFRRLPAGQERDILAALACADAVAACGVLCGRFGVEGDAFQLLAALVAAEAFGVETASAGTDDAPGDRERAVRALGAGADGCGCPVGAG